MVITKVKKVRRVTLELQRGQYRRVLILNAVAIKVPLIRCFAKGLRCNRWEREVWRVWRHKFNWNNLCPVLFADPFGLVVVMPRAEQPITEQEMLDADEPDSHPATDTESKIESFGRWNGRVVAIDYGIASSEHVRERRPYYRRITAKS